MVLEHPHPKARPWLVSLAMLAGAYTVMRAVFSDGDFDGFHRAAQHVLETGELSVEKNVLRYLPSFQVFMVPFGLLPLRVAAGLWFCCSLGALWMLPGMTERLTGIAPREQLPAWLVMETSNSALAMTIRIGLQFMVGVSLTIRS